MAPEDAVVLATCLRDVDEVPAALATYERLRRGRVEKIVAAGRRTSSTKVAGPVSRRPRDALLSVVLRSVGRDGAGGQALIYDHDLAGDSPITARVEDRHSGRRSITRRTGTKRTFDHAKAGT